MVAVDFWGSVVSGAKRVRERRGEGEGSWVR
jgi:hypothetical protein